MPTKPSKFKEIIVDNEESDSLKIMSLKSNKSSPDVKEKDIMASLVFEIPTLQKQPESFFTKIENQNDFKPSLKVLQNFIKSNSLASSLEIDEEMLDDDYDSSKFTDDLM